MESQPEHGRLRRSRSQRVIAGVCGGIGVYLGIDAVLVRIALVVLVFAGFGTGVLLYIAAVVFIREETAAEPIIPAKGGDTTWRILAGAILVGIGAVALVRELFPWLFRAKLIGPLVLIGIGVVILSHALRHKSR